MRSRCLLCAAALAAVCAWMSPSVLDAQAPKPGSTYTPPRTPWGDPDIQGVYDYQSMIPMERPTELAGKKTFSDSELVEWARTHTPNQDVCGIGTRANEVCTDAQRNSVGAYNEFWDNRNIVHDNRTSLIEDPPDGKFPPMTAEGQRIQSTAVGPEAGLRAFANTAYYNTWADFNSVSRCIAEQTPNGPQMYNSGTYVMQTPGWVLIVRERLDTRIIPLDGRAHVGDKVRQWNGDSRGRWEGNTLVVETTNFTNKQDKRGVGSTVPGGVPFGNIKLTERFVPVSANRIHYYATIDDPNTWTKPWTFMLPWEKDPTYTIYEYACHEANISVGNALRGERLKEAEAAAKK
jgi:hypothetical protein